MIWAGITAVIIASLIVGTYCDRQNQKAYLRGFNDGLGVQILEIKELQGKYSVEWEEKE